MRVIDMSVLPKIEIKKDIDNKLPLRKFKSQFKYS